MKRRNRKKAFDCAHHEHTRCMEEWDDDFAYSIVDYCKLGKYDKSDIPSSKQVDMCETCTKFCASRPMIRKKREDDKRIRELLRGDKKYYNEIFRQGLWEEDKIDNNVIEALNELTN